MGGIVTINAYCEDEVLCNRAIDAAFREMKQIDRLMSVFDERSQLSRVNQEAGNGEVTVDGRIIEVIESARRIHSITAGAFDVSIEPLMELYGFRDDSTVHHLPSDKQIADALEGVGMENVTVNRQSSTIGLLHPTTRLDFGGIAVGYAIDCAVGILKSYGIESALVNHSGDVYALGAPPHEDGWEVGITDPKNTEDIITSAHIKDRALSTSGNYENLVEADGHTIGHILNPMTGKAGSTILSGTAIADTSIEADALSTGMLVLGLTQARILFGKVKRLQIIAVITDGENKEIVKTVEN